MGIHSGDVACDDLSAKKETVPTLYDEGIFLKNKANYPY